VCRNITENDHAKVLDTVNQEYVYHDCDTSEIGASRFAARDVHRIGILDIRIWNTDRHAGNILVRRSRESALNLSGLARLDSTQMELVPIDHGFCLPEALEPPYFEWLHWPQVTCPGLTPASFLHLQVPLAMPLSGHGSRDGMHDKRQD
jgi:hypothetical protein